MNEYFVTFVVSAKKTNCVKRGMLSKVDYACTQAKNTEGGMEFPASLSTNSLLSVSRALSC